MATPMTKPAHFNLEIFIEAAVVEHEKTFKELASLDERKSSQELIKIVCQKFFALPALQSSQAVLTAGAIGSGKSYLVRSILEQEACLGKNYIYICPDEIFAEQMRGLYPSEQKDEKPIQKKWLPLAHFISRVLVRLAVENRKSLFYQTTSLEKESEDLTQFIKRKAYQMKLIHLTTPDHIRWQSVKNRVFSFNPDEREVHETGKIMPTRLPLFMKEFDVIDFYFREDLETRAQLAAIWYQEEGLQVTEAKYLITDFNSYLGIKKNHDEAVDDLMKQDPLAKRLKWEALFEKSSKLLNEVSKV